MGFILNLALCLPFAMRTACAAAQPEQKVNINVVHVLVSLCDNENQGIVPVPARIGNGLDYDNNLYWGARYGVRTFFNNLPDWEKLASWKNPSDNSAVLERVVFRNRKTKSFYLVAEAWRGDEMKQAISEFYFYAAGERPLPLTIKQAQTIKAGGDAQLVVFIGHNGLMDIESRIFPPKKPKEKPRYSKNQAAVFACQSLSYFKKPLEDIGARPILLTTGNMAPEAYVLEALLESWRVGNSAEQRRERVAKAYHEYQKCGLSGARRLFYCE